MRWRAASKYGRLWGANAGGGAPFLAEVAGRASGVGITGGMPEAHFHPDVCTGGSSRERVGHSAWGWARGKTKLGPCWGPAVNEEEWQEERNVHDGPVQCQCCRCGQTPAGHSPHVFQPIPWSFVQRGRVAQCSGVAGRSQRDTASIPPPSQECAAGDTQKGAGGVQQGTRGLAGGGEVEGDELEELGRGAAKA
ncbi:hypothetical protein DFH08DRAFT_815597 [Mycena albidolilacea]|uniref:Uncharacterized protein n=1 Tax=Mycena albidolilacea TaxID=1033008 RepID=A0AAD7EKB0_9AGAR|nr:hypothetical protein DFH08DRAFT_815597 [Mycena albidolilacea]